MRFQLGEFKLQSFSGGRLWLDGGAMFGIVPKVRWARKSTPDEYNRIPLDTNCLLVRAPAGNVLIDTGYGSKCDAREREHSSLEDGHPLLAHLEEMGVVAEDIDWVILSHLHFDHAGGGTSWPAGTTVGEAASRPVPTFPKARYVVQRREWEDATGNLPELARAYDDRNYLAIQEFGQLHLVDGDAVVLPGISVRLTGGHTRGHQVITIEAGGQGAVYLGDLCPTAAHLRCSWTMAYDSYPLEVRRIKPAIVGEIADRGWLAVFDHDPQVQAAYLQRDGQDFAVREAVAM